MMHNVLTTQWRIVAATAAATVLMTSQPFLTGMTRNMRGGYDSLPLSITLSTEQCKLSVSAMLPTEARAHPHCALTATSGCLTRSKVTLAGAHLS